jgi:hypothetical protein
MNRGSRDAAPGAAVKKQEVIMYALVLTISLNLQGYPLFNLAAGQPVYMRTTSFKVAVGQFATKAECEAYTDYKSAEFTFSYTDTNGNPQSIVFTNVPMTVNGCDKVL